MIGCRLLACDWSAVFRLESTDAGDYQICFDNSFSRFSEKMVFFEVILDHPANDVGADDEWAGLGEPESLLEYKLDDIKASECEGFHFKCCYFGILYTKHYVLIFLVTFVTFYF